MFITTAGFKHLIKEAYNNKRLIVGGTQEEFLFEGGYWIIRIRRNRFPKKEKAAVVELTGDLPAAGEVFRAAKGEANQYEIPDNGVWDIGSAFEQCEEEMTVTRAVYQSSQNMCRVIQHRRTNSCFFISEKFISFLDGSALTGEEEPPEGPVARTDGEGIIYWKNSSMTLAVCHISDGSEELSRYLRLLENMELPEQRLF